MNHGWGVAIGLGLVWVLTGASCQSLVGPVDQPTAVAFEADRQTPAEPTPANEPSAQPNLGPELEHPQDPPPAGDYRRYRTWQALRGLNFDSGLVTIDQAEADQIAARGTVEQALARYAEAVAELERNHATEALGLFRDAILIWPDSAVFYEGLGRALIAKKKTREALAAFRTAVTLDPTLVSSQLLVADMLNRLGERIAAAQQYEQVLQLQPAHATAHVRLAIIRYYLGQDELAWHHLHAADALGADVPAQFRRLLAARTPEPG